jgi:transcriptional regulator with XRE-family HTH domain
MALEPDEVARRIRAARELRGLSQAQLGELLAADGLGSTDAGRIERNEIPMTRVHRDALIRALRVPERWLTADNVDEIVGVQLSDEDLARLLGPQLLAAVRALRLAEGQEPPDEDAQDHP